MACRLSIPASPNLTFKYVDERRQNLDIVKKLLPSSSRESFDEWRERELNAAIAAVQSFTTEDAIPVLNLLLMLGNDTFFDV